MSALLELTDVCVRYPAQDGRNRGLAAVDGVSGTVAQGEMLGLVGESGSGKTTLGRAILRLVPLANGEVRWLGRRIDSLSQRQFRPLRRDLQLVYQDPDSCLDPRMTISESIGEPLRSLAPELPAAHRSERISRLMEEVSLAPELAGRYPHQLSGGQLQRAVIARALIVNPRFVVCDEPVSALDVSVQGQIVNLLARIRRERGLASLFISHNLAVVARLCERIMVMYRGRIVESAPSRDLVGSPKHPYSRELLDAVPVVDVGARARLRGRPLPPGPELADARIAGCVFATRCPFVLPKCRREPPTLAGAGAGRLVACHRAAEWPAGLPPPGDR